MTNTPWRTSHKKDFIILVTSSSEEERSRKINEHVSNGYEIVSTFSNTSENRGFRNQKYYAKLKKVNNRVALS